MSRIVCLRVFQQFMHVVHRFSPFLESFAAERASARRQCGLLKPSRMLDEDRAPIENCKCDNQPALDQEIQLVRHAISP